MLEDIRIQALQKIKDNKASCEKWINDFSLSYMKLLEDNKEEACGCRVIFNRDEGYEIGEGDDKHTVILNKQLGTCRAWDLTRIPYPHAICALYHSKKNPNSYISKFYHKSSYLAVYEFPLLPVPGKKFMKIEEFQSIEPPPLVAMPSRPKKKRVRAINESNMRP
ncbi:hypothetical protein DITRI_Ditri01bG0178800 [Diplodiscus trichospermus]